MKQWASVAADERESVYAQLRDDITLWRADGSPECLQHADNVEAMIAYLRATPDPSYSPAPVAPAAGRMRLIGETTRDGVWRARLDGVIGEAATLAVALRALADRIERRSRAKGTT